MLERNSQRLPCQIPALRDRKVLESLPVADDPPARAVQPAEAVLHGRRLLAATGSGKGRAERPGPGGGAPGELVGARQRSGVAVRGGRECEGFEEGTVHGVAG